MWVEGLWSHHKKSDQSGIVIYLHSLDICGFKLKFWTYVDIGSLHQNHRFEIVSIFQIYDQNIENGNFFVYRSSFRLLKINKNFSIFS